MALSEHEERILAEIERQLAEEDPRFVARARRVRGWSRTMRVRIAAVMAVLGLAGVLSLVFSIVFAAVGMVLLFGAIVLAATVVADGQRTGDRPSD